MVPIEKLQTSSVAVITSRSTNTHSNRAPTSTQVCRPSDIQLLCRTMRSRRTSARTRLINTNDVFTTCEGLCVHQTDHLRVLGRSPSGSDRTLSNSNTHLLVGSLFSSTARMPNIDCSTAQTAAYSFAHTSDKAELHILQYTQHHTQHKSASTGYLVDFFLAFFYSKPSIGVVRDTKIPHQVSTTYFHHTQMTPTGIDWGWVQTRRTMATKYPSRSRGLRKVVVGGGVQ